MNIEMQPIARLREYRNNPRKNDHAVEQIAAAIKEFGFRVPVLVRSDGEIVDGHLRYKAALHLGLTEIPCVLADDMTEEQIKAYRISVNRMAELADWDEDLLKVELQGLQEIGFDLELTGYLEHELDEMLGSIGLDDDGLDDTPPVPSDPLTQPGDLWALGVHRLLCGDSTSMEDMSTLLVDQSADMIFTDPPYNVDYQGAAGGIKNDKMSDRAFAEFLSVAMANMVSSLKKGGGIYIAHADTGTTGIAFRQAMLDAGAKLAACLVWKKNVPSLSRSDYQWQHEPILYGWRKGAAHAWYGGRKKRSVFDLNGMDCAMQVSSDQVLITIGDQIIAISGNKLSVDQWPSSLFSCEKPVRNKDHPTMKPVALVAKCIKNSSRRGDLVLDPFAGSGSTLVAAEMNGRKSCLMELDPRFCDVIVKRWEKITGKQAIRIANGREQGNDSGGAAQTLYAGRGKHPQAAEKCLSEKRQRDRGRSIRPDPEGHG